MARIVLFGPRVGKNTVQRRIQQQVPGLRQVPEVDDVLDPEHSLEGPWVTTSHSLSDHWPQWFREEVKFVFVDHASVTEVRDARQAAAEEYCCSLLRPEEQKVEPTRGPVEEAARRWFQQCHREDCYRPPGPFMPRGWELIIHNDFVQCVPCTEAHVQAGHSWLMRDAAATSSLLFHLPFLLPDIWALVAQFIQPAPLQ